MTQTFGGGPVPPETNPPINPQYYQPSRFTISELTLGTSTTVTTSVDNNYVVGQLVRLLIPYYYGSWQISGLSGYVTSVPAANEVVVAINSLNANSFIPSPAYGPQPPQIIALGEINSGSINNQGIVNNLTYIPGSFINISPA